MTVTARLWLTHDHMLEGGDHREIVVVTAVPTLVLRDEEFGLEATYRLRRVYVPGAYDTQPASADYIYGGIQ